MNHLYKIGQIVSYTRLGNEWVGEVTQVSGSGWIQIDNNDSIRHTNIIKILLEAPSYITKREESKPDMGSAGRIGLTKQKRQEQEHQERLKNQAMHTTKRIERSAGEFDYELDKAQRSLMIDYALDTGNKELFMQLTTPTSVGSVV